jgi:DNA-directed RNA polymerase subunit RPC12/RpoP
LRIDRSAVSVPPAPRPSPGGPRGRSAWLLFSSTWTSVERSSCLMADEIARCPDCGHELTFQRYNARFGDQGYMYCDKDSTVLTWGAYDPIYTRFAGQVNPWMLDQDCRSQVERRVIACPSGGRFRFAASPRCPRCSAELPELQRDPAYFVVLGEWIDGEAVSVWRDQDDGTGYGR